MGADYIHNNSAPSRLLFWVQSTEGAQPIPDPNSAQYTINQLRANLFELFWKVSLGGRRAVNIRCATAFVNKDLMINMK